MNRREWFEMAEERKIVFPIPEGDYQDADRVLAEMREKRSNFLYMAKLALLNARSIALLPDDFGCISIKVSKRGEVSVCSTDLGTLPLRGKEVFYELAKLVCRYVVAQGNYVEFAEDEMREDVNE